MIFRLHKHTKGSFAPSDTDSCRQPDLKGAFPRSLQAPLSMGSPLSADQFTLWPPTPRHGEPPHDGAQTYSFSTTEERSADNSMVSTWDPSQLDLTLSYCPMPGTGIDIPQVEGTHWDRSQTYPTTLSNVEPEQGSSYSSTNSSGFLSLPDFQYAAPPQGIDGLRLDTALACRRLSDDLSSADPATSSTGYYDDRASHDGSGSYLTEYTPRTSLPASSVGTPLSPAVRGVQRGRRSASPSRSYRVSPYDRKRWSAPGESTGFFSFKMDPQLFTPRIHSQNSSPICAPELLPPHPSQQYIASYPQNFAHGTQPFIPAPRFQQNQDMSPAFTNRLYVPSQCRTEHPTSRYDEYTEPPDLFSSIRGEEFPPPPEDMDPDDHDLKPREQEVRFEGDFYTPRWVRGHGNKREGWCGLCKPGRWLVLKNSAFWYDKSFAPWNQRCVRATFPRTERDEENGR